MLSIRNVVAWSGWLRGASEALSIGSAYVAFGVEKFFDVAASVAEHKLSICLASSAVVDRYSVFYSCRWV